ncbi:hypothetical protein CORC01_06410 [Colletotrichum orchidophilum]|uniref:Erythromycin biosynthesis protein CIII-like C-terminal domain-containing protein n=1 Tax=Colletotrichum orchidophilum TaxID=1209926 RepID=A0A1G4B9Y9_9PEZI|nr:uncharacterized protein CORC01_06410 [Colletotrichum orchidophilum]OHE98213.1 hypothetical protein CORC01_06410 [Colletotrichum orchidophilum]
MTANKARVTEGGSGGSPLILIVAYPGEGHTNPLLTIAAFLAKKGYEVAFLTTEDFRSKVEDAGAEWVHTDNPITSETYQALRDAASLPIGPERFAAQIKAVFFDTLPLRTRKMEEALTDLKARDPGRQIIVIEDVFNWSIFPFRYGRPLPQGFDTVPKSIGIGVAAFIMESRDTAPVTLGLPPDSTGSGRQRNAVLQQLVAKGPMKPSIDAWQQAMRLTGCTTILETNMFRSCYTAHDFALQLCSPSLEYELSDLPPSVEFIGVLPRKPTATTFQYPPWWPEVERNHKDNKYRHVIFVSQGTINMNHSELVLPTIEAFSKIEDTLVVAALGVRGAQLPHGFVVPSNARVVDYMPYDTILEYTDVFISNGGYGALTHAVRNGVPIVLAGESEEKMEVTMRAVYAGLAVSLATQRPSAAQVRLGVEQIFQDTRFKKAAMKLKHENEDMDALAAVEAKIRVLTL